MCHAACCLISSAMALGAAGRFLPSYPRCHCHKAGRRASIPICTPRIYSEYLQMGRRGFSLRPSSITYFIIYLLIGPMPKQTQQPSALNDDIHRPFPFNVSFIISIVLVLSVIGINYFRDTTPIGIPSSLSSLLCSAFRLRRRSSLVVSSCMHLIHHGHCCFSPPGSLCIYLIYH